MRDVQIERVLDAPRALVWQAFTDPDQIAQWFGPVGYSVPRESVSVDLRVGGEQHLTMVPDDPSYPPGGASVGVYDEIVEHELIVTHEDLDGEMAELFGSTRIVMRMEFHEEGEGRTRLVITQGPYRDDFIGMVDKGWESSFTKLDALLGSTGGKVTVVAEGDRGIVITRAFAAPRQAVYDAWTQPEFVTQWWPGQRGTMLSCESDLRVGGQWRYAMHSNSGHDIVFYGEFLEIEPGHRIVSTETYEPFPDHPSHNVITFEEQDGVTTLTIRVEAANTEARDAQIGSGMEVGIEEGFDILERLAAPAAV